MGQIELIPRSEITANAWWGKLSPSEQRTVLLETQALSEEMVKFGMSRIAIGEHLVVLRDILEPKRIFTAYLRRFKSFSKSSAYRYIEEFLEIKDRLPEVVLRTAMARGYKTIDLKMVDKNPPPKTQNTNKIVAWLDGTKKSSRKKRLSSGEPEIDRDTLVQECIHVVRSRAKKFTNGNARKAFYREFGGMVLWESGEESFTPIEIPERFTVRLGRPPKEIEA